MCARGKGVIEVQIDERKRLRKERSEVRRGNGGDEGEACQQGQKTLSEVTNRG